MSPNSIGYYARNLHWFWRFVWFVVLMSMPWTWFLILMGIWHLDNRLEELEERISSKAPTPSPICYVEVHRVAPAQIRDRIQTYNKEAKRWE